MASASTRNRCGRAVHAMARRARHCPACSWTSARPQGLNCGSHIAWSKCAAGHTTFSRPKQTAGHSSSGSLVLATGGLSIPKLGATGFTHDVARRFGLRLTELRPGLVPLTFSNELLALMRSLTGVSLDSEVALDRHRFHETMLFTHRGLSGPAILQISSYWQRGPITLNLLPGRDASRFLLERKRARPKAELRGVLAEVLPQRLAQALAATMDPAAAQPGRSDEELPCTTRMAELPDRVLRDFVNIACNPSRTTALSHATHAAPSSSSALRAMSATAKSQGMSGWRLRAATTCRCNCGCRRR